MSIPPGIDDVRPVAQADDRATTSPIDDLRTLQMEVRNLIHDQLQLAALEVRLASRSLMTMIAVAVCIGALLVLVWVGLMAAMGLSLLNTGLQPAVIVLVVTALTAILMVLLFGFIRRRSRDLGFPATLRTLKPSAEGNHNRESI